MLDPSSACSPLLTGAAAITRGARRHLAQGGCHALPEVTLPNGRRADLMGMGRDGTPLIIEVKSGPADFLSDSKWPAYLGYCQRFWFAVDAAFPLALLPDDPAVGILIADSYGAVEHRPPANRSIAPARRRAMVLHLATLAARRLHQMQDPWMDAG